MDCKWVISAVSVRTLFRCIWGIGRLWNKIRGHLKGQKLRHIYKRDWRNNSVSYLRILCAPWSEWAIRPDWFRSLWRVQFLVNCVRSHHFFGKSEGFIDIYWKNLPNSLIYPLFIPFHRSCRIRRRTHLIGTITSSICLPRWYYIDHYPVNCTLRSATLWFSMRTPSITPLSHFLIVRNYCQMTISLRSYLSLAPIRFFISRSLTQNS